MTKLNNRLLKKAAKSAQETHRLSSLLTEAFIERYGIPYSDVDADAIIDALDYGNSVGVTLEECDEIMTEAGYPPLDDQSDT